MGIERTATAICDVCEDEEVMGTRPFDEIPDGWAWLDLIGKKVRLLCPVCAGIIYSGGWPEGKTAVSPSAIELADEITRARNAGALAALQAVKERGSEFSIWDIIDELADEYGGFADGEETA